jgi:hypothetical protein
LPVKGLSKKLFSQMKIKFTGEHRPLLPAMLPTGNAPDGVAANAAADAPVGNPPDGVAADAADGDQDTSDAHALGDSPDRTNVAPDASASVAPDVQPPPSPRSPTPVPSLMDTTSPEQVLNENLGPDQPVNSPQYTRLPTPSPLRPNFEDSVDVDIDLDYTTHRTIDDSNTTDIPVGGSEGPVTLSSVSALLNRSHTPKIGSSGSIRVAGV